MKKWKQKHGEKKTSKDRGRCRVREGGKHILRWEGILKKWRGREREGLKEDREIKKEMTGSFKEIFI